MNRMLRHIIVTAALLSMALLSVSHAFSPIHQDATDLPECTFCLHHAGNQLHTAPHQISVPQPLEISAEMITLNSSTVFVRSIRSFFGRAPPQLA